MQSNLDNLNILNLNDRVLGCILGLFVGDAAGATLEFRHGQFDDTIVNKAMSLPGGGSLCVGKGQITDDSELAIHLWRGLFPHNPINGFPTESVAKEYIDWYKSYPFDIGLTCRRALNFSSNAHDCITNAAKYNNDSEANGSLMRIAPLAIWASCSPDEILISFARQEALLTHPNQVCQDANAVFSLAIVYLLKHDGDADGAINHVKHWLHMMHPKIQVWFNEAITLPCVTQYNECKHNIGHLKHAFTLAFVCLKNKMSFHDGIHQVLKLGGDTDTNAAITGALLGALHGLDAIPKDMVKIVMRFTCTEMPDNDLIGQKRPDTYIIRNFIKEYYSTQINTTLLNEKIEKYNNKVL